MTHLILVRHGESRWNAEKRFTGWIDVPLTQRGVEEALTTAKALKGYRFDVAFTSLLHRAQETLLLILSHQQYTGVFQHTNDRNQKRYAYQPLSRAKEVPVHTTSLLNERYYGSLQGMKKSTARRLYGKEQVFAWRRSWTERPPEGGESIKDTYRRTVQYFKRTIMPELEARKDVVVVAHGNCLRTIIKCLENISDDDIPFVELPTGKPIIYSYSKKNLTRTNHTLEYTRPLR